MLSWNLWRYLQYPPLKHAIYRRVSSTMIPLLAKKHRLRMYALLVILTLSLLAAKLLHINIVVFVLFLPILFMFLMIVSPLFLPFAIFFYSAYLTTRISHTIFMEMQQATYDLLHLSPHSPIHADWIIGTGILYQGQTFGLLNFAVRFVLFLAGIVLSIGSIALLATGNGLDIQVFIEILVLLALLYTGYLQSIILSIIIGLLVPHYTANIQQNSFNALVAYLLVQCGSYLTALLAGMGLLQMLYNSLHITNWLADISLVLWYFVLIYGIRELLIIRLWRHLAYILNSDSKMLE